MELPLQIQPDQKLSTKKNETNKIIDFMAAVNDQEMMERIAIEKKAAWAKEVLRKSEEDLLEM